MNWIEGINAAGLCGRRDAVHTGGNSGYQAIGLARNWGAERIILLGYDMQQTGGRAHWHPDHASSLGNLGDLESWRQRMIPLERDLRTEGILVINATATTALKCFTRMKLTEALEYELRKEPIIVRGMHGLGDNLHQRALISTLMETREVWLESPWPCVYHDLRDRGLRVIGKGSSLRTQAKNSARESTSYYRGTVPRGCEILQVSYPPSLIMKHGGVLQAMAAQTGIVPGDFTLPLLPDWEARADALLAELAPEKPIMIFRPLMERKEWTGCRNRNPQHEAYFELVQSVRDEFFVISVADEEPGQEWFVGSQIEADASFHKGELDFEILAALTARAAFVLTAPGFAAVLAQAVATPVCVVFGGYEDGRSFSYGARYSMYLPIEPIRPCPCFSHSHKCTKGIDCAKAVQNLRNFTDAINQARNAGDRQSRIAA